MEEEGEDVGVGVGGEEEGDVCACVDAFGWGEEGVRLRRGEVCECGWGFWGGHCLWYEAG